MTVRLSIHPETEEMSTVLYEQAGKIVTITIDRPDAMDAVEGPKTFAEKRKPNFQAR